MKQYFIFLLLFLSSYLLRSKDMYEVTSSQYKYIEKIYTQVKLAYQKEEINLPIKVYDEYVELYAIACVRKDTLRFNYETVDTCFKYLQDTSQVNNIIAYILGHEISHYIHKDKIGGYACALHTKQKLVDTKTDSLRQIELQRDKEGHFYARVAGFRPNQMISTFFDKIYPQLVEENNLYPSQKERLKSIEDTYTEADRLYHIFEADNFLVLFGYYEEAAMAYEYLIQHFPSREMYYNAGSCYLSLLKNSEIFANHNFNIALMLETSSSVRSGNYLSTLERNAYLEKANILLQKAYLFDNENLNTYLAQLYFQFFTDLNNKKEVGYYYVNKLDSLAHKSTNKDSLFIGTVYNFLGIAYYQLNLLKQSTTYFQKAASYGIVVGKDNLCELNPVFCKEEKPVHCDNNKFIIGQETINNFPVLFKNDKISIKIVSSVNDVYSILIYFTNEENELRIEQQMNNTITNDVSTITTYQDLLKKYGLPSFSFSLKGEKAIIYTNCNSIFLFNKDNKVIAKYLYLNL